MLFRYVLHSGAKDNFVLDERTGVVSVAEEANLDILRSGDAYEIIVRIDATANKFQN